MMRWIFIAILFLCCSPVKRAAFNYPDQGVSHTVSLRIPKGSSRLQVSTDSAGNTVGTWHYGRAEFFIAHVPDSNEHSSFFQERINIPRRSFQTGALIFKGQDSAGLFWREVRQYPFRVGYRYVSGAQEYAFDSASNYPVVWPLRHD